MASQDPKEECKNQATQAGQKASDILADTEKLQKWAQRIKDLADAESGVLNNCEPVNPNYEQNISTWQSANRDLDFVSRKMSGLNFIALNSTASGTAFEMSAFGTERGFTFSGPPSADNPGYMAKKRLNDVLDSSIDRASIMQLMRQFGLDKPYPNEKSAVEQFQTAWEAYDRPVTQSEPVITSLIPIRSSIEITVDALLRRRPIQERTGKSPKEKVLSIGRRLAWDGRSEHEINDWAQRCHELVDELSPAKKAAMSRVEWYDKLRRATFFLQGFLSFLDPSKLR